MTAHLLLSNLNKKMYLLHHVVFIFVLFLVGLQFSCNEQSSTEIQWKYESEDINSYFEQELNKLDVKTRKDESNSIWFNSQDYSKVEKVKKVIFNKYLKNSVSFTDEKLVDDLCDRIINDGYECITWRINGRKYASWKDNAQKSAEKHLIVLRAD